MIENKSKNQILHFIIGACLLLISICLYIGLRPIFILASFALALFLVDYSILPFIYIYQAFIGWLPILFELNIFNTVLILARILHLSKFWTIVFSSICIIRSLVVIYCQYLPIENYHRLYVENKLQILSKLISNRITDCYNRFIQPFFNQNDDTDISKFQLEQINSAEHAHDQHDETIERFQRIADDLESPMISNIECSNTSTPPIRRHHQRLLQQSELEPFSRTPITPAHTNNSKVKILHSTINASYTGPITRNRKKTGGTASNIASPIRS